MSRRNTRLSRNWRMGMNMQMTLWTTAENQLFFSMLVQSIVITKGCGLKLTQGVLDMSALELIVRGLASDDHDWLLVEELEAEYPRGSWSLMIQHLADMHKALSRHTMFEINYKILRAIENIILPLNAIFTGHAVGPEYLANSGRYHPLSMAIARYCDYCYFGDVAKDPKDFNFIDYFMQAMLAQHGVRMCTFLDLCRNNLIRLSTLVPADESELVVAMEHLSLGA
ncbi:hypothetical protein H4S02_000992 [Coemansia sp. RSA 2611]|nr:hypothetical protein IWW52_006592 [Coemansia sp. RSA 2704]KAJ2306479.1 hypothetical protein IWW54_004730 [Coemansia sp. RSA 2705]KAJ2368089.1 hypothetical protein H4S01_001783 [Coemansia sp. RSA 2610]KAJ2392060.1 hypothetical protein H4S02_000992 [Coemansia sp. RSA 2611]KAJ2723515.1 hypothetical protein H4R23_004349 [Coemansia sp. Cherry 401B]